MSDEETLYEKGARNLNEVYAGDVAMYGFLHQPVLYVCEPRGLLV